MPDDAISAVAALAATQHGALTRRQAGALGVDHRRIATAVRRGWLTEPVPGVLVLAGSAGTWRQRLAVVLLAAGGRAVASHRAAAALHGLDGFTDTRHAVVEASVTRSCRLDVPDATIHHVTRLDEIDRTSVGGLACTNVARTLADLGAVVHDRDQLRRALTSARRDGTTLRAIRSTVERVHRPGPSGTGPMLRLLDAVPCEGRVPDSWFEELLAGCLRNRRLPPVVPQCPIVDEATGRIVARCDLGILAARLGLEAHSRRFHWGPIRGRLDEQRDLAVATCGWALLYLGWYATRRPAEVLTLVRQVVATRLTEW